METFQNIEHRRSGSFQKFKKLIRKNTLKNTGNYSMHSSLRPNSAKHLRDCFGNKERRVLYALWSSDVVKQMLKCFGELEPILTRENSQVT